MPPCLLYPAGSRCLPRLCAPPRARPCATAGPCLPCPPLAESLRHPGCTMSRPRGRHSKDKCSFFLPLPVSFHLTSLLPGPLLHLLPLRLSGWVLSLRAPLVSLGCPHPSPVPMALPRAGGGLTWLQSQANGQQGEDDGLHGHHWAAGVWTSGWLYITLAGEGEAPRPTVNMHRLPGASRHRRAGRSQSPPAKPGCTPPFPLSSRLLPEDRALPTPGGF